MHSCFQRKELSEHQYTKFSQETHVEKDVLSLFLCQIGLLRWMFVVKMY